jgi:hypothetical protein
MDFGRPAQISVHMLSVRRKKFAGAENQFGRVPNGFPANHHISGCALAKKRWCVIRTVYLAIKQQMHSPAVLTKKKCLS